uniref:Astakine-like protein 1 n=1 Tax=Lygus lineolaris TaxID=50650 RepID=A0A0F6PKH0_LYGLI|nr:astakine-like protein 1 [Lygus lineolaris]
MKMVSALTVLCVAICAVQSGTMALQNCTSTSECAEDECCMLSPSRYSTLTCTKLRSLGEQCRPNNAPTSEDVYFTNPGSGPYKLTDVYVSLCDCSPELTCSRSSGTCETPRTN